MAGFAAVSPRSVRAVGGAILAFKAADADLRKIITTDTKSRFTPEWQRMVRGDAGLPPHGRERARMLRNSGSVTIKGTNPLQLAAYQSGSLGKGKGKLSSRADYGPIEFGDGRKTFERYVTRSRKGRRYTVNRRTQEQLPPRQSEGYAVYPNVAGIAPRIVSYWVQSVVWTYYDALDGRVT